MEICQIETVDELLRGGWHRPRAVQHYPVAENCLLRSPLVQGEVVHVHQTTETKQMAEHQGIYVAVVVEVNCKPSAERGCKPRRPYGLMYVVGVVVVVMGDPPHPSPPCQGQAPPHDLVM